MKNLSPKKRLPSQWIMLGMTLLLLGAPMGLNLYLERGRITSRVQERLVTQARVIQKNLAWNLDATNKVLSDIQQELSRNGKNTYTARQLGVITNAMPGVRTLNILNADGTVVASNWPELVGDNFRERDYFMMPREHPVADRLYVSPPFKTSLGIFALNVVRVIPGPRGEFAGVIAATLDPEYFTTLLSSVLYSRDMWTAIAHGDGMLFMLIPEGRKTAGKNLAQPGTFFTRHRNSGQETTVHAGIAYLTGEKRLLVWQTVQPPELKMDKPLMVAVSRDLDLIYAGWRRNLLMQGMLFAITALLASLGLYAYQRRQREYESSLAQSSTALRESAERLQMATQAAAMGVWDYNLQTGLLIWDDSMFTIYGTDPASFCSSYHDWSRTVLPEDLPAMEAALQASLGGETPFNCVFRIRRGDGEIRNLSGIGKLYYDPDGAPLRLVGLNEDITERIQAKERLSQAIAAAETANEAKSTFLANMSHEIRTPMNAILGLIYLMHKTGMNLRQQDYIGKIENAATSLLDILNDILDFSKVEAGRMELERVPFDLNDLLRKLSVILSANAGHKQLEIVFDIDSRVPGTLVGDPLRLQQVLINLAGNAVKFTEQGEVVLSVSMAQTDAGQVSLDFSISDTGIGISRENLDRIFDGFTQAEISTNRKFGGTGLGLAISSRLVRLMGGGIQVASKQGRGSTFSFRVAFDLPAPRSTPDAVTVPYQPPAACRQDRSPRCLEGVRILVAEDNYFNQLVSREILEDMGARVVIAGNGREAVERVASGEFSFDVVLMDVQMPIMDGYQATREIRDSVGEKGLPIIAMTANAFEVDRQRCLEAGMNDHLAKPLDVEKLVATLERYCTLDRSTAKQVSGQTADLPLDAEEVAGLPGLDLPRTIRRMNGNRLLYGQMARMACTGHIDIVQRLERLIHSGDTAAAGQLLHTFRGVMINLGAAQLGECAGTFEAALHQGSTGEDHRALLARLERLCNEAFASLRIIVKRYGQGEPTPTTAAWSAPSDETPAQAPRPAP
ncbi:hybrid sensor histidine kinase/response regulator [Geobacter sp. SVR]|uniref:hybrid sensor histidine kinase/response regulator n=1 Tax=Geobacter sp. SVR TaxID=2495594 RepID=UPI00143EFF11|nr:hybrid sensor histidine kinase/response regulator [Geobacter sp. SVR]BCS55379.1 hypothetical protein GSVR_36870 [Geobacter sp. SVR]GCF87302.1 hypothetical protein GSbR_39020 [Geobacter sp. SVR]